MSLVPAARWLVQYEGQDVSDDISRTVLSIEYTDHLAGKSDELTLTVADREGRWREGWWPSSGDRLFVRFGYEGGSLLDAGEFSIDEIELSGPPDSVSIRALATPMTGKLRDVVNRPYELTTLREVVVQLAAELELELVGDVEDIPILRVTQAESSLAFLRRLAEKYGYAFSVRPPRLVFYPIVQLELASSALTLDRSNISGDGSGYRLKAGVQGTYVACEVRWFDPSTKAARTSRVTAAQARERLVIATPTESGDNGTPPSIPDRTLRQGVTGEDVRSWQAWLTGKGYDAGSADGIFGPRTRAATMAFQRANGLGVDGVGGPETFRVAVEQGFGQSASSATGTRSEVAGVTLYKEVRVENAQQAEEQARSLLAAANRLKATGDIVLARGDIRAVAGAKFTLQRMGRMSGEYLIQKSTHRMDRSGAYGTSIEVSGV